MCIPAIACSVCRDGMAAIPDSISIEVDDPRSKIIAATSAIAANAGIVRRIMFMRP